MYNTIRNTICMTNGITLRMEGGAMRHSDISSAIGAQRRVPVSLRVPADLADEVDGFAREHGVRKTDAYLFLIKKGLQRGGDEGGCEGADARVGEYRALLDDLSALLQAPVSAAREAQKVREAVAEAASLFPAIERAYLFGSFARGSQTAGSDVDVRLVIGRGGGGVHPPRAESLCEDRAAGDGEGMRRSVGRRCGERSACSSYRPREGARI